PAPQRPPKTDIPTVHRLLHLNHPFACPKPGPGESPSPFPKEAPRYSVSTPLPSGRCSISSILGSVLSPALPWTCGGSHRTSIRASQSVLPTGRLIGSIIRSAQKKGSPLITEATSVKLRNEKTAFRLAK